MTTLNIWNKFEQRLHAFILSRVADRDLASDLLHDVFEKIHIKLHTLQSEDKLESWLFSLTRNTLNDHFRKTKRNPTYSLDEELDVIDTAEKEPLEELVQCLIPFFRDLPSPYKEVLYDYQFKKIPQKEIAEQRNVAYATVRSQIQRARKMLYDQFICCCKEQLCNADVPCPTGECEYER